MNEGIPQKRGGRVVPRSPSRPSASQIIALFTLVAVYAAAAVAFILIPGGATSMASLVPASASPLTQVQTALGTSAIILVGYGGLGLLGLWFSRRLGLPGVYKPAAGVRTLLTFPMVLGLTAGGMLILLDRLFRTMPGFDGFPHPPFPASILASITAGIGEEVLFRLFVMTLWLGVLSWVLRKLRPHGSWWQTVVWTSNAFAALAFAAGHLGTAMILYEASSPIELPLATLGALVVMNGSLGLLAGWQFVRSGLIAAVGVHFWADIAWHVVFGAVQGG